ncbi:uncharacterized protein LOC131298460 [Rhododendron vialii]|uniref:uncharacterized protein LOC131298460 n=1 Tax=Rhododendron vialii TaxID=182163 RepID=UPI00265F9C79|nr:uncharacterized protein LOC131298460 [Rhododendron vialii]
MCPRSHTLRQGMDQQPITPPRHQHKAHRHHHRPNTTVTVHLHRHRHRNPDIRTRHLLTRDTKGISVKGTLRHRRSHLSLTKSTIVSITNTNTSPVVSRSFEAVLLRFVAAVCWRSAASKLL